MSVTLVNGVRSEQISTTDRAFNYGDGIFETIAVHNKKLQYWPEHFSRLIKGCEVLSIAAPAEAALLSDVAKLDLDETSSVIKIIISRGQGGRGYATKGLTEPNIIISNNTWPTVVESYQQQGIKTRLCQHRLIINPALSGIKHLNRLDQVLARNEWHNDDIQEGLMLDQNDHIIEGTCTNVFMKIGQQWVTAADKDCAVAGVMKAAVIKKAAQLGLKIEQRLVKLKELALVKEMFVCNSIWGVVPVLACDSYQFELSDECRQLQTEIEQDKKTALYDI